MKVSELLAHIDSFAPFALAEEWDNSGLMVGSFGAEVGKVAVALDAVNEAVVAASEQGCNVLLCHHPLIFKPLKHVNINHDTGRTIAEAITRNITIIAAHTNWDKAEGGVNDTLALLLGLQKVKAFQSFGVHGVMPESMSFREFLEHVKTSWGLSRLECYARNIPETISKVALCGGSGADFWKLAKNEHVDIYLTADMKYHELIDATRAGLNIALAEHGEMERASLPSLAEKVSLCGVETVILNVKALSSPIRI